MIITACGYAAGGLLGFDNILKIILYTRAPSVGAGGD